MSNIRSLVTALAPSSSHRQRIKAAVKLLKSLEHGHLDPTDFVAANGVIPCLAMAQKVKRLPDLSPAPDNEPADLELGDTAMMLLGLLSGVGEQLLGNEGWLIFPSEDETAPVYVHMEDETQTGQLERPEFPEWPWQNTLMLQLLDLMCPVTNSSGEVQWPVSVVEYLPGDKPDESIAILDVWDDGKVHRQLVLGCWRGLDSAVEFEINMSTPHEIPLWDLECTAEAVNLVNKRENVLLVGMNPAVVHAVQKFGASHVHILERNEDICTQAQEYFRIDPSLTTLTILQNPWEYKPDRRYDAILVLDREDDSCTKAIVEFLSTGLADSGVCAIALENIYSVGTKVSVANLRKSFSYVSAFTADAERSGDDPGVLLCSKESLELNRAPWSDAHVLPYTDAVQDEDWELFN